MTFDLIDLSTISGVILATMFFLEILKRIFQTNKGFGKVPTFVWAIIIAEGLVFTAHYVLHDEKGMPVLIGRTATLAWRAFLSAASASGFYTWLNRPTSIANAQPLGQDSPKPIQLGTEVTKETTVQKAPGEVPNTVTNTTTEVTKHIAILLTLGLLLTAGCKESQIQKAYLSRQLYASSLTTMIDLRKSGVIDDASYKVIEPIRANADQATKTWLDAAVSGQNLTFANYEAQASKALDDFLTWIVKTQAKK